MRNKKRDKFGDRRDGVWIKETDPMHAFVPYLYPNRADNEAFISERIDLEEINRYIEEKNSATLRNRIRQYLFSIFYNQNQMIIE